MNIFFVLLSGNLFIREANKEKETKIFFGFNFINFLIIIENVKFQ